MQLSKRCVSLLQLGEMLFLPRFLFVQKEIDHAGLRIALQSLFLNERNNNIGQALSLSSLHKQTL
jgi:hypothetical protein